MSRMIWFILTAQVLIAYGGVGMWVLVLDLYTQDVFKWF